MKRYLYSILFLLVFLPFKGWAVGWTPTDAGLVLNFEPGDQFLLSVMIDDDNNPATPDVEYFVCDYPSYNGGKFKYEAKDYLKLVPQTAGATTPSPTSIWTVGDKLTRIVNKVDYDLGGICYTMWGNSSKTLVTSDGTFKILGSLTNKTNDNNLCDVIFVVPTDNAVTKSMDPNNTTGRAAKAGDKFNGRMGVGFAGMVYREVYWFGIPRSNNPISYTNAALVTFNTTSSNKSWSAGTIKPGFAAYAYADTKHNPTTRTVFRMYVLNEKAFSSCSSYFFGWNVQDYVRYRQSNSMSDFTSYRKIYTLDHFECMEHETMPDSSFFKTQGMRVPSSDSTYYYVGRNNTYVNDSVMGEHGVKSSFKPIDSLRIRGLRDAATAYRPPKDAFGFFVIDTLSTKANLGVAFEPIGYMLRTSSGKNVAMIPNADRTLWTSEEMWTISGAYAELEVKATLLTGSEFSEDDPGADIEGWSEMVKGKNVPVSDGGSIVNKSGWAQIDVTNPAKNGGIRFILADQSKCVHFDNNGFIGLQVPDQFPKKDETKVKIQDARLKEGFTFLGWSTTPGGAVVVFPADSTDKPLKVGDSIDLAALPAGLSLTRDTLFLYAKATFDDTYRVAFSFVEGGKRYWLTHPNTSAPRFARARTFTDWTDVYQGMSDAENSEPNYLSTYKMIGNPGACLTCEADEYVLDPRHETVHGVVDSLTFYENWAPSNDEFIGLYYTNPNTILANNTWAGIFKSTEGWPAYNRTAVDDTKLYSEQYFDGMLDRGVIEKKWRRTDQDNPATALPAYVKYDAANNQFDGVATAEEGTSFQITGIAVADEHYVILPDTTDESLPWRDEITFGYHMDEPQFEQVWSKLIGKQLMAVLRVGPDTVYFHPNRRKTFTTANELRLSADYRLTQTFEYIHDARPAAVIEEAEQVTMEETENAFCCNLQSAASSPIGPMVDVVDTLRVWLRPSGTSKIKKFYGRWDDEAADSVLSDGSRYRDILVKTKAYHYDSPKTDIVLSTTQADYSFSALANQSQTIEFALTRVTYRELKDAAGTVISRDTISTNDTTSLFDTQAMDATWCSLGGSTFTKVSGSGRQMTIKTTGDNSSGALTDTLTVTIPANTFTGISYAISVKVPLIQSSLQGDELVWSVEKDGRRYFILASSTGLIFREFSLRNNTLYKWSTTTTLIKGAANAANDDDRYITPWKYAATGTPNQLKLYTKLPDVTDKYFRINAGTGTVDEETQKTIVTFDVVRTNANDNANYEEVVKLKVDASTWLKFTGSAIETTTTEGDASTFYWGYLLQEWNLLNNGTYPSVDRLEFGYDNTTAASVTTAYKAYREYSMLLNNSKTYLCREEKTDSLTLTGGEWKTSYAVSLIHDSRFKKAGVAADSAKLTIKADKFTTKVTPTGSSPRGTMVGGKYVNIVDTLQVTLGLQSTPPAYRFKDWKDVSSVSDACVKIPLVRKTYHDAPYDSLMALVDREEYNFAFPSTLRAGQRGDSLHTFYLETVKRSGTNVVDVEGNVVYHTPTTVDTLTDKMALNNPAYAEIRLVDDYGKDPEWCAIESKGASTITVRCKSNGIRTPRSAYLYFAYIIDMNGKGDYRYVNFKLTVSQNSYFQYANNQTLIHTPGASGDPLMADGRQQAHENKRILYYYNPEPYDEADQDVELPIRERGFYGWWRWYQENEGVEDTDIPDSAWINPPRNVGKYNYPFRIIGDSVMVLNPKKGQKDEPDSVKVLVTMGRYTVFHYPAVAYNSKKDAPAKSPHVHAPYRKETKTYVVDLSAYYDNLPLSMAQVNQIDTAVLDTMRDILEPTLSLREAFELHPWTEMAQILEGYKDTIDPADGGRNLKYMEDHEVMAPIGNRLLLRTEQRYRYDNLAKKDHSESLLGYYMRDDHWSDGGWNDARKDTMIWCGGWDADCKWYTFNPADSSYTECNHPVTVDDDFLNVPAKTSITTGKESDTVYYCLRARSQSTTVAAGKDVTVDGKYMFNICRYKVIYHDPRQYGPFLETGKGSAAKALITNDEIEQNYEVLERLNFDYVKPGKDYHVYPHPLPWADASYGYSYPVSPEVPDNRYHNDFAPNFPGVGEYGIVNRIPYGNYWHKMEQHGGAENGYMIYCDGMSSAGQVAALSLETQLCEGQKMYFSGFVGNPSNQKGKSNPNFTFSVQGSKDGETWTDITSYMTGDIQPSDKWYQIYFPINQSGTYDQFRVRIYNVASDFDGNDFIIDDMCIFATKPPLIAYQANTKCVESTKNDSITQVVLRVDYQGFVDSSYNSVPVFYTVEQIKGEDTTFVAMEDEYLEQVHNGDSIYGKIRMPSHTYVPLDEDSIFTNLKLLVDTFEASIKKRDTVSETLLFRQGYIYENLDGIIRPVMYVLHEAKMTADNKYNVRMSLAPNELMSSVCAMTSNLKVTNHMMLELNGEEQNDQELTGMCANTTYDLSVRVKGSLYKDSIAPIDLNGSCVNDWLLYGDTTAYSTTRYGYSYSDIKAVIKDILRYTPLSGESNINQFAPNLASVNRNVMKNIKETKGVKLSSSDHPYDILAYLVNNGFLTLYQSKITATVAKDDSVQYVVFPIEGTGSEAMYNSNMEVCPAPMFIKLHATKGGDVPLMVGGIRRDSTQANSPVVVLTNARTANEEFSLHIDSLMNTAAIHSIHLMTTDDPECYEGVHLLTLEPDRVYNLSGDNSGYYRNGDDMLLRPATSNNYQMRPGYNYTFGIVMQTRSGFLTTTDGCDVGTIPFTVSVVPDYLRWAPKSKENNQWNNPENWIGVDVNNVPLHENAHFAPIASTDVIIPAMPDSLPYPELPELSSLRSTDSVRQVGFVYNTCDDIRFLAGAAIGQQQRLNCDVAVVDMSIPQQKWALRSAPVKGMLSGDLFLSEADLSGESRPWTVGQFDASGRSYKTGNASFWLSLYNRATEQVVREGDNENRTAAAEWTKVTNGLTLSLDSAQGWAVYGRTASGDAAEVRLPKDDDIYYYYGTYGERLDYKYVDNLRALRTTNAGGTAGKLAFRPGTAATHQDYTLTNGVASTSFVFGNPTMGYIDIWGFIADNSLTEEISYLNADGHYQTVTSETTGTDTITNPARYLPPMHAMVINTTSGTERAITLNTNRIVTHPSQKVRPLPAPVPAPARQSSNRQSSIRQLNRGIMTVTAINPVSDRCVSRLLLGQGYDDAIRSGEDAVLTTLNIDKFHMTNTPTTPFNIYAVEGDYGMSIDLRSEVLNVPVSFYMSALPYEPVTQLWFTGVNTIDGTLVLYDALTDTEREIIDGICLDIETPELSHEKRYYIRRRGYDPNSGSQIATDVQILREELMPETQKILRHGQVYILRGDHVYTIVGQKIR